MAATLRLAVTDVPGELRDAGKATVESLRAGLLRQVAAILRRDPERLRSAVEMGLVRPEWLENPVGEPVSTTSPPDVLQRFLEREVERHPSLLRELGLSILRVVNFGLGQDQDDAASAGGLAVVFTDFDGFTAFTAQRGDGAASELLGELSRVVGPIVRSRGGRIVKHLGDGRLITFPEPEAAVLGALELVEASPGPLRMRAGGHWGRAIVTRDDVIGHDVNVAARVTDIVPAGKVLVTGDLRDAAHDVAGVRFGRAVRRRMKGIDAPVRVCRVAREIA